MQLKNYITNTIFKDKMYIGIIVLKLIVFYSSLDYYDLAQVDSSYMNQLKKY